MRRRDIRRRRPAPTSFIASLTLREKLAEAIRWALFVVQRGAALHLVNEYERLSSEGGALGVCMCSLQVARECGELRPGKREGRTPRVAEMCHVF